MKNNLIHEKSFEFTVLIIDIYRNMIKQNEYVLSKQLLTSGNQILATINRKNENRGFRFV